MARDYAKQKLSNKSNSGRYKSKRTGPYIKFGLIALLLLILLVIILASLHHHGIDTNSKTIVTKPTKAVYKPPQFDFYTILPKEQVNVAQLSITDKSGTQYFLQVSAVKDQAAADHFKAELGLLGFDVYVRQAKIDNAIWYRIDIGPYASEKAAKADQQRLAENNIKSILRHEKTQQVSQDGSSS